MATFPHPRLRQLFEALRQETLSQEELARRLQVSTRTVRSDVALLNEIIAPHGAHLAHSRGEGYQLTRFDPARFERLQQKLDEELALPRTSRERVIHLMVLLLGAERGIKLDELADTWYLSRTALQGDMGEVRERLARFGLQVESRAHQGLQLVGDELAIRACLTQLLAQEIREGQPIQTLLHLLCPSHTLGVVREQIQPLLDLSPLRFSDDSRQQLALYCAIVLARLAAGKSQPALSCPEICPQAVTLARTIFSTLPTLTEPGSGEISLLAIQLQGRSSLPAGLLTALQEQEGRALVKHLLEHIAIQYGYELGDDEQLARDLLNHVLPMLLRVRYHIASHNPLTDHIKQHYPLAYDITLGALAEWCRHKHYDFTDHEIGYLVIHVGVGLERRYDIGYRRPPRALLVCDGENATARLLEARIRRDYPQLALEVIWSLRDYEARAELDADFVISTSRLEEKGLPLLQLHPFPTQAQLEQLGKLVLSDRTRPYLLNKYFSPHHFLYLEETMSQTALFRHLCHQLEHEGSVPPEFHASLCERERIVSTWLGDGIATPHSLALLAHQTCVYTVLAPEGIEWGQGERAQVIFLLAIGHSDYEEAMGLYDIFLTLMNEKASRDLLACHDFTAFYKAARRLLD